MYSNFAYIYDKLMYDVDYSAWADYIEEVFSANKLKPSLILDLGCGTGNFCIEMAKRGYEMIGLDLSTEMLDCAKNKSLEAGVDVLYLNQDMTNFELYGTVDVVVCLMDSINYVTNKKDLKNLFRLAANYLNPQGLFIFDVNSEYKLEEVLGNNVFYDVGDDLTYLWENRFDKRKGICEFDLTFFIKEGETYRRHDEVHYERAYSKRELKTLAENANLEVVNIYSALKRLPPSRKSQRIFFVCKKSDEAGGA